MAEEEKLDSLMIDALTEAGNIGAGHAATSLSKMLRENIMNHSTTSNVVSIHKVPDALGGAEKIVAGIYTTFSGELTGGILMLFPEKSVNTISKILCESEVHNMQLSEMQNSMLCEIGNICLCWYLDAIGKLIGMDLIPTPPVAAYDMIGAVIDLPLIELGKVADSALVILTEFKGEVHEIEGIFLMLPEPESQKEMAKRLGVA
jgi:chemotaxis protein CheC